MDHHGKGFIFYGWIVLAISFITLALSFSIRYSYPVFNVVLEETFGWSRTSVSFAYSLHLIVYGIGAVFAGSLFDRLGPRIQLPIAATLLALILLACSQLNSLLYYYIFAGVLTTLAMVALDVIPNISLLCSWFVKKRGQAVGLATAGLGLSMIIAGTVITWIIKTYGFRWAYAIMGLTIFFVITPMTALFQRHRPEDMGLKVDGDGFDSTLHKFISGMKERWSTDKCKVRKRKSEGTLLEITEEDMIVDREWADKEWPLSEVIKTSRYWLFFSIKILVVFAVYCVLFHQIPYAVDRGFSKMAAGSALGITGLVAAFGKIIWGYISDRIGREITFTIIISCACIGVLILMNVKDPSQLWMLYVYAVLYGIGYGSISAVLPTMCADVFGPKSIGATYGLSLLGSGIGGSIGPLFAAYIFDKTGSYHISFTICLIFLIITIIQVWVFAPRNVMLVAGRARARAIARQRTAGREEALTAQ